MRIGLVVMASGLGKRFGGNKLMTELMGKPMLQWVLDAADGVFDRIVVVTRSTEVEGLCRRLGAHCVCHTYPGRNDTVRLGITALQTDVEYCFFVPGDQPLISRDSMQKLRASAGEHIESIVRAGFGERVGAPVGFPKKYFKELCRLPEGKGGNFIAVHHPEEIETVMVERECELFDVDTKEDMETIPCMIIRQSKGTAFQHGDKDVSHKLTAK